MFNPITYVWSHIPMNLSIAPLASCIQKSGVSVLCSMSWGASYSSWGRVHKLFQLKVQFLGLSQWRQEESLLLTTSWYGSKVAIKTSSSSTISLMHLIQTLPQQLFFVQAQIPASSCRIGTVSRVLLCLFMQVLWGGQQVFSKDLVHWKWSASSSESPTPNKLVRCPPTCHCLCMVQNWVYNCTIWSFGPKSTSQPIVVMVFLHQCHIENSLRLVNLWLRPVMVLPTQWGVVSGHSSTLRHMPAWWPWWPWWPWWHWQPWWPWILWWPWWHWAPVSWCTNGLVMWWLGTYAMPHLVVLVSSMLHANCAVWHVWWQKGVWPTQSMHSKVLKCTQVGASWVVFSRFVHSWGHCKADPGVQSKWTPGNQRPVLKVSKFS